MDKFSDVAGIWRAYQLFASTSAVRRKGYELVGMTSMTPNGVPEVEDSFVIRGESDLEHQAKVAWLTSAFIGCYGNDFFQLYEPNSCAELWSVFTVALNHDIGEVATGDVPDDGSEAHDTKNEQERIVFGNMLRYLPAEYSIPAQLDYWAFQDLDGHNGRAIYALDKLEAVLTLLLYEKHGCRGMITAKVEPSEADKYYMRVTRSETAADCWAAHLCAHIRKFPDSIKRPILALLDAAVLDVRGEPFLWWNRDILPYERMKMRG